MQPEWLNTHRKMMREMKEKLGEVSPMACIFPEGEGRMPDVVIHVTDFTQETKFKSFFDAQSLFHVHPKPGGFAFTTDAFLRQWTTESGEPLPDVPPREDPRSKEGLITFWGSIDENGELITGAITDTYGIGDRGELNWDVLDITEQGGVTENWMDEVFLASSKSPTKTGLLKQFEDDPLLVFRGVMEYVVEQENCRIAITNPTLVEGMS